MRIIRKAVIWLLLLIFWLPLLAIDLSTSGQDFGPMAAEPYIWFASLGTTVWIIPVFAYGAPAALQVSMFGAVMVTVALYLIIGIFALRMLDIGPVQELKPD